MDKPESKDPQSMKDELDPKNYAGRWIARIDNKVVGQGGTPDQALYAAKHIRPKETPEVLYVPTMTPMDISAQIEHITKVLPDDQPVYLVGGAVRDALLGRDTHDLDFVVGKSSMSLARKVADSLGAAYYPLDEERQTARVVIKEPDQQRQVVDFALLRGPDLESDLRARDFTMNAMAVEVREPERLLDPLSGLADLRAKRLRACSHGTFEDDPIRILRGIRLAAAFEFRIVSETRSQMRKNVGGLSQVSSERIRDEIFRILDGERPATSLWALDLLGANPYILPELVELKGVSQPAPHRSDVWLHTLDVMKKLEILVDSLGPVHDPGAAATFRLGLVAVQLGRYRDRISAHLGEILVPGRTLRSLLFWAALYHDTGKPEKMQVNSDGRIRFIGHEQLSADLLRERGHELRLSNEEIDHAARIVRYHMRPQHLARQDQPPTPRAVYRFFRSAGQSGVDICLLSLADLWAKYGSSISQESWAAHLEVVRTLLDAWFEYPGERVHPERLLNGNELMQELDLPPGPEVGELLEAIREAQVAGEVEDREQALSYVRSLLKEGGLG